MKNNFNFSDVRPYVAVFISLLTCILSIYSNKIQSEELEELKSQNEILLLNNQLTKTSQKSEGIFEVNSKANIDLISGEHIVIPYQVVFYNTGNKLITLNEIGYKNPYTEEHYNLHILTPPYIFSWEIESLKFDSLLTKNINNFPTSIYINLPGKDNLNLTDIQFYVKDINGNYYYDSDSYHGELHWLK